jgi:hypothetical protein
VAYVVERKRDDGTTRFLACYRDPEGWVRSAGTHATRRAAERAAHREEQKVLAGSWRDASLGAITFRDYVENDWLPSKHIEPTTKAVYVSNLNRHLYPFRQEADVPDHRLPGPRLGDQRRRRRSLSPLHRQVPHHAALHLQASGPRPAHRDQPV